MQCQVVQDVSKINGTIKKYKVQLDETIKKGDYVAFANSRISDGLSYMVATGVSNHVSHWVEKDKAIIFYNETGNYNLYMVNLKIDNGVFLYSKPKLIAKRVNSFSTEIISSTRCVVIMNVLSTGGKYDGRCLLINPQNGDIVTTFNYLQGVDNGKFAGIRCRLMPNGKLILAYNNGTSWYCAIATITNDVFSFGAAVTTTAYNYIHGLPQLNIIDNDNFSYCINDSSNSYVYIWFLSINGNTITTKFSYSIGSAINGSCLSIDSTTMLVGYFNGNTSINQVAVLKHNTTSVISLNAFNIPSILLGTYSMKNYSFLKLDRNNIILCASDNYNAQYMYITMNADTPTITTPICYRPNSTEQRIIHNNSDGNFIITEYFNGNVYAFLFSLSTDKSNIIINSSKVNPIVKAVTEFNDKDVKPFLTTAYDNFECVALLVNDVICYAYLNTGNYSFWGTYYLSENMDMINMDTRNILGYLSNSKTIVPINKDVALYGAYYSNDGFLYPILNYIDTSESVPRIIAKYMNFTGTGYTSLSITKSSESAAVVGFTDNGNYLLKIMRYDNLVKGGSISTSSQTSILTSTVSHKLLGYNKNKTLVAYRETSSPYRGSVAIITYNDSNIYQSISTGVVFDTDCVVIVDFVKITATDSVIFYKDTNSYLKCAYIQMINDVITVKQISILSTESVLKVSVCIDINGNISIMIGFSNNTLCVAILLINNYNVSLNDIKVISSYAVGDSLLLKDDKFLCVYTAGLNHKICAFKIKGGLLEFEKTGLKSNVIGLAKTSGISGQMIDVYSI